MNTDTTQQDRFHKYKGLVFHMLKYVTYPAHLYDDLVSVGYLALWEILTRVTDPTSDLDMPVYICWVLKMRYVKTVKGHKCYWPWSKDKPTMVECNLAICPDETVDRTVGYGLLVKAVREVFECLSEPQREVMALRYGVFGATRQHTYSEIAEIRGCSPQAVQASETWARKKLRKRYPQLREYLE